MKIKAVVFKKNHTLAVKYLSKKERQENQIVVDKGTYLIGDDDNFIITKRWIGVIRLSYITYYYREGDPKALDCPLFDSMDSTEKIDEDGERYLEPVKQRIPISSEELNELFAPAFYRMVRGQTKNTRADIQYYLIIGIALVSAFVAWRTNSIWSIIKDIVPGS